MDLEANTSIDSNHGSTTTTTTDNKHDARKQQFTTKQRMDMYAFCVLELELHGNTVSIKKQQQAIQKALKKDGGQKKLAICPPPTNSNNSSSVVSNGIQGMGESNDQQSQQYEQQHQINNNSGTSHNLQSETSNTHSMSQSSLSMPTDQHEQFNSFPQEHPEQQTNPPPSTSSAFLPHDTNGISQQQQPNDAMDIVPYNNNDNNNLMTSSGEAAEKKTLMQLKQEIAKTQRCYSDYQKTQVLTSSMLREVQRRFAKYYPDTHCPSRTTIKHVFMKCVENGTVENVKNPRKPTKIPNGDQIEQFLIQEPQMSLREMAKKLNVSTGTVSRRCRALGIVPESVTLKHQQMAMAKRQKQMKQMNNRTKTSGKRTSAGSTRQQQATLNHHEQSQYTNGMV